MGDKVTILLLLIVGAAVVGALFYFVIFSKGGDVRAIGAAKQGGPKGDRAKQALDSSSSTVAKTAQLSALRDRLADASAPAAGLKKTPAKTAEVAPRTPEKAWRPEEAGLGESSAVVDTAADALAVAREVARETRGTESPAPPPSRISAPLAATVAQQARVEEDAQRQRAPTGDQAGRDDVLDIALPALASADAAFEARATPVNKLHVDPVAFAPSLRAESPEALLSAEEVGTAPPAEASAPSQPAPRVHVLLVDDSKVVRVKTEKLLASHGYVVTTAVDGLDALAKLETLKPAMIITDIEMPNLDGFGLVRNVRGNARTAEIPVIVMTSHVNLHLDIAATEGINGFLPKPFNDQDLLDQVAFLCES